MKITGLIAEYNPFHKGHEYQIKKIKDSGSDFLIVVMSGDFTQRGEPAIIDKYQRAKMALDAGADLCIELPVVYALGDAGRFAKGGVSILDGLGCVDTLAFGTEPGTEELTIQIADFLTNPPTAFETTIDQEMRNGLTYPAAREKALSLFFSPDKLNAISSPNAILGIEYCKALKHTHNTITPMPITRIGAGYNETNLTDGINPSASGIRKYLEEYNWGSDGHLWECKRANNGHRGECNESDNEQSNKYKGVRSNCGENLASFHSYLDRLNSFVPASTIGILKEAAGLAFPIFNSDLDSIMRYKLLQNDNYKDYTDIADYFSDRISAALNGYTGLEAFEEQLKAKNITRTSVNRLLMHILLDMKLNVPSRAEYARILGFRQNSSALFSEIKKSSIIPLISKLSDAKITPSLKADITAANIYSGVVADKFGVNFVNEYSRQIVKI